ncbi:hypothetical protein [Candidatus Nanohalococcus occultus]|uniref:Uncharacterized protein n=1 Tax=Candidatus Nanohalococcus occultus TaxID=2978047 RepID=A0ABY8CK55_9ARCH|nr:hypothetical protein SVXNc_1070 [Candidatus Nanohaloarchaeota archaeon SVXNc]
MNSNFLRTVLAQESRAYGFTLAFWGSGIVLVDSFGLPDLGLVLSYTGGAILGFGLITLAAFRQPLENVEYEETDYMVFSMIHFISALVPILLTSWLTRFEPQTAFLVSGASVSMNYNLLMILEERLAERIAKVERRIAL